MRALGVEPACSSGRASAQARSIMDRCSRMLAMDQTEQPVKVVMPIRSRAAAALTQPRRRSRAARRDGETGRPRARPPSARPRRGLAGSTATSSRSRLSREMLAPPSPRPAPASRNGCSRRPGRPALRGRRPVALRGAPQRRRRMIFRIGPVVLSVSAAVISRRRHQGARQAPARSGRVSRSIAVERHEGSETGPFAFAQKHGVQHREPVVRDAWAFRRRALGLAGSGSAAAAARHRRERSGCPRRDAPSGRARRAPRRAIRGLRARPDRAGGSVSPAARNRGSRRRRSRPARRASDASAATRRARSGCRKPQSTAGSSLLATVARLSSITKESVVEPLAPCRSSGAGGVPP